MMPSRGLCTLKGIAPSLVRAQTRSFSIARSSAVRSSLRPSLSTRSAPLRISSIALSCQTLRHNSTSSDVTKIVHSNLPNIDTLTLDQIDFATGGIDSVERIGYLKDIGLDHGWWSVSTPIQWTIEHFHIWADLPWWASIMATAFCFRAATLPLIMRAQDSTARMHAMSSVLQPITNAIKDAQRRGDSAAQREAMLRLFAVRKQAGISVSATLMPALAQMVIGFSGFSVLSAMCAFPVPGLQTGGFGWITDLTVPDGYLILPTIFAGILSLTVRLGGEMGNASALNPRMVLFLQYGLPFIAFVITGFQSAALALWFTTTGAFSLAQAWLLRKGTVRRMFNISPVIKLKPGEAPTPGPFADILERYQQANAKASSASATQSRWQPPNFSRSSGKIIDTKLVNKEDRKSFSTIARQVQHDNRRMTAFSASKRPQDISWR